MLFPKISPNLNCQMKSNIFFASKWISKETKVKQQTGIIAFVLHKQLQQFSFQSSFVL